ncbi:alpha/beta fold hydrolase [Corallococcus macrosporus]|uniref:AB hydrolase-1 domain-containing protein n=1 Tax=Corallococcus macrosporus DSM 14697 TaxID=1189310 RepID=A0A250JUC7_9BACT|nr:alpha/beta fold hydrolase [Corallococcus macrosporus]ATB47489.1 hypothetical protein MYMAC_003103 [Corallococcus macrosporus DSM 14697]
MRRRSVGAWWGALAAWLFVATGPGALAAARTREAPRPARLRLTATDAAREAPPRPGVPRSWQVTLYYPGAGGEPTRYFDERTAHHLAATGYYDMPAEVLRGWAKLPGPAVTGARFEAQGPAALIVLLPGMGMAGDSYAFLASRLVTRGFVVAVVELPYAGVSRAADGEWTSPGQDPLLAKAEQADWGPRIAEWVRDVTATLDLLRDAPRVRSAGVRLEGRAVIVAGHSLGGAVALDSCAADERIAACADFEGAPFGTRFEKEGSGKPTLFVLSRSRRADRPETAPEAGGPPFGFLANNRGAPAWAVAVAGGSHMSFSDAPVKMPGTLSRFGGELMRAERSMQLYSDLLVAFARAYRPGGLGDAGFRSSVARLPEARATLIPSAGN